MSIQIEYAPLPPPPPTRPVVRLSVPSTVTSGRFLVLEACCGDVLVDVRLDGISQVQTGAILVSRKDLAELLSALDRLVAGDG